MKERSNTNRSNICRSSVQVQDGIFQLQYKHFWRPKLSWVTFQKSANAWEILVWAREREITSKCVRLTLNEWHLRALHVICKFFYIDGTLCARSIGQKLMFYQSIKRRKSVFCCFSIFAACRIYMIKPKPCIRLCLFVIRHFGHFKTLERCKHFPRVLKCPSCFITIWYTAQDCCPKKLKSRG